MTESTRESLHEALSAAIDNEAEELELRRVLNAVERDPELRATWERMHLISDMVRGQGIWLRDREAARPAESAMPVPDIAAGNAGRGRWLTGLAAAAAVMAAAVFVAIQDRQAAPAPILAQAPATPQPQAPIATVAVAPSEEDLRRTRDYLMYHAQHTSLAGRPAMTFVKALAAPGGSEEGR